MLRLMFLMGVAHLFSDIGRGCVYNCHFCSERQDVAGKPRQLSESPDRLYRQMREAAEVILKDYGEDKASGFVEDSVLLGGSPVLLNKLAALLEENPLQFSFGAQLTIDQILARTDVLRRLKAVGLDYIFIGLETFDPQEIGGMSKDLGSRKNAWVDRADEAIRFMYETGIHCGAAILFGLGESHRSRIALFEQVKYWRNYYGIPNPVSMNWAVQHPLSEPHMAQHYDYIAWGTPEGPYLDIFHHFGEASLLYPLHGVTPPTLDELHEIHNLLELLETPQLSQAA
jgi:2-iminoacetate synthase ThiH